MHSRIFQISTEPIDKENYLNEDTLQQGDGSFYDYCSEIDEENRKEDIANLVNYALPNGMFELISDDTMRYNGGIEQWKEEYVANIKKRADALTAESQTGSGKSVGCRLSFLFGWRRLPIFCRTVLCVYGVCL